MPLAVNTGLSDAILARYGNFARGVPIGAEMLLLPAAPEPPEASQTIIRLAETVWNLQSLVEHNTILNLHLNLSFYQRLAAAAVAPAVETMVRELRMRERFLWARMPGSPGNGRESAAFVPAALETRGPEPSGEPFSGKAGERNAARAASSRPAPLAQPPISGRGEAAGIPLPPARTLTENARHQREAELPGLAQIRTLLRLAEPAAGAGRLYASVPRTDALTRPNSFGPGVARLEAHPVDFRGTFPPVPQQRGSAPGNLPAPPVSMPKGTPMVTMGFPTPPGSARGRRTDVPFPMATAPARPQGILSRMASAPEQTPGSPPAMATTPARPQGILSRMVSAPEQGSGSPPAMAMVPARPQGLLSRMASAPEQTPGSPAVMDSGPEVGMEAASKRLERTVSAQLAPAHPAGFPFAARQKPLQAAPTPLTFESEPLAGPRRARMEPEEFTEPAARQRKRADGSEIPTPIQPRKDLSQTGRAPAEPSVWGTAPRRPSTWIPAPMRLAAGIPAAEAPQTRSPFRTAHPAAFAEPSVPITRRRSPVRPLPSDPVPSAVSPQNPLGRSTAAPAAFVPAAAPLFTRPSAQPASASVSAERSPQRQGVAVPREEMPPALRPAFTSAPVVLRPEAPVSRAPAAAEESLDIPTVRTRRTETKSTVQAAGRAVNAPPADISGPAGQRLSQAVEEAVGHMDLKKLTERVYRELETRLRLENTRRGKW